MLAKIEFFEVYRMLWVLEFVNTDLEDQHLQIEYFTSENIYYIIHIKLLMHFQMQIVYSFSLRYEY